MRHKKQARPQRSHCPVACALDIIGDRWTLLVVRDLLKGKKRYGEFLESEEKIPTNILADRLKTLENDGVVEKVWYSEHPPRAEYHLTEAGKELGKIVKAMYEWGSKHSFARTSLPKAKRRYSK
ncbi:MAG: helix-turn-helix domain-containing protein [Acidobacteriota bacterium]